MKKKTLSKVSLGDVARAANVSVTTAGCALRNLPGVGEETRQRILDVAQRLNYFPDPRLASTMAGIRRTVDKDVMPVVWLNTDREKDVWHKYTFLTPYLEGARSRLKELGYRIEEIWTREPGSSMRRIAQIIESQGVEGVIVTEPGRRVRLNWQRLAGVSLGGGLWAPALHRVGADNTHNVALALKSLRRLGYRRIGVCVTEQADRLARHGVRSAVMYFHSIIPRTCRVEPLFTPYFLKPGMDRKMFAAWLIKEQPDAVVGNTSHLISWVEAAGFRVPDEVGVVHLAIDDDVLDWAGIYANKREIGRLAASKLVSLIQQREFGIPAIASAELVPGVWRPGRTVLAPKPKVGKRVQLDVRL